MLLAVAIGIVVWFLITNPEAPQRPPRETTFAFVSGTAVPSLISRYAEQDFHCRQRPSAADASEVEVRCIKEVSKAAVTVQFVGRPMGLLPVVVVRTTTDGHDEARTRARSWAADQREVAGWVRARAETGGLQSLVLLTRQRDQSAPQLGILETEDGLARRFAPILQFARKRTGDDKVEDEAFLPLRVDGYLRESDLCEFKLIKVPGRETAIHVSRGHCDKPPSFDSLGFEEPSPNCGPCFLALDVRGAEESQGRKRYETRDRVMRHGLAPAYTVYYALRPISHERFVLEYWMFYAFNDFDNRHEGDWEMIAIELAHASPWTRSKAVRVAYSAHHSTLRLSWPAMVARHYVRQDHPLVYVGYGSHANYFKAGRHNVQVQVVEWGGRVKCGSSQDITNDAGPKLLPDQYELRPLTMPALWASFTAAFNVAPPFNLAYGPYNYLRVTNVPGKPPTSDPRATWRWTDPFRLVAEIDTSSCQTRG
jgi:hypothetical protein